MAAPVNRAGDLLGSWKLVSAQLRMEDTGEVLDLLGPDPRGFIAFGPGGRMMTVLAASGRTPPADDAGIAATFRGTMAYTGRFTLEGDRVVTEVDVAWHPAWENTRQVRHWKLEGDRLTLTTDVQDHPGHPGRRLRGVIVWTRES